MWLKLNVLSKYTLVECFALISIVIYFIAIRKRHLPNINLLTLPNFKPLVTKSSFFRFFSKDTYSRLKPIPKRSAFIKKLMQKRLKSTARILNEVAVRTMLITKYEEIAEICFKCFQNYLILYHESSQHPPGCSK